jgi:hypothetical protein
MTMMMSALMAAAVLFTPAQAVGGSQPGQTQTFGAQQRTPPRDAALEKKGTGVIRGKIVNAEGRPLRRVQLRLSGESIPEGRTASTNGLGRFEIKELAAGRYTLNASRAGYLSMSYGQSRPGEPGRPIELADGQALENADFVLPHTALISGHVFDEAGEPLAGANVLTLQMRFFNGRRRLTPVRGNAITDDTGQYRLSGLEPGEYYVQASSRETWEGDPPEKQMLGFLPTFFPTGLTVGEAQRVRVRAGQEVSAVDIGLLPGKVAKISGTVVNAQGMPLAGETVSLSFEIRGENFMSMFGGQGTKVNPDGTFQFRNIAPGEYHLNVRTAGTAERPSEAANVIVSALGTDVEGVSIVTNAAGAVVGRVVVAGDAPLPLPLTKLTVRALPVDRDTAVSIAGIPDNGRVREDGSFELKSIAGQARLTIAPLSDGWAIRQIDQGGRDFTLQPFDTQGQTLDGFTITLTNRFPAVSGTLRDEKGNSVLAGTTILFPDEPSLWVEDLRSVRTARVDQSGIFTIKAVRPGDYLAVAVPAVTNNQWNDPEYLESLREHAKRISLKEGDVKQIDLVVVK